MGTDTMAGGGFVWILLIFLLIGGGSFLGGNNKQGEISNDFMYTNLNGTLQNMGNAINNGFQETAEGFCGVNYNMISSFKDLSLQLCDYNNVTNRNIDASRFQSQIETADIINNIHLDGEATRALINNNTVQDLRDRNAALTDALSNEQLVGRLSPRPVPAYQTCSPYESANFGCAC